MMTPWNHVDLAKYLQRRVDSGGPLVLHPSDGGPVHEVDAYSASPACLASAYQHGAGTDQGGGKGRRWYCVTPARCHPSTRPDSKGKRWRAIAGGDMGDGCCTWRSEGAKNEVQEVVVVDGGRREIRTVGYFRALCCGSKNKRTGNFERCGWCMLEFGLHKDDGRDKFVLCVLYKSPRASEIPDRVPASEGVPIPGVPAGADVAGPAAVTGGGASEGVPAGADVAGPAAVTGGGASEGVPAGADVAGPAAVTGGGASEGVPIPVYVPAPLRSPGPGVALLNPAFPIGPLPWLWLGGETPPPPRVAIVRRADPAATVGSVVMKFGSSSIPSAGRLKDAAELVCAFPASEILVVVLSGMGNTNHNILQALTKAMTCDKDHKVSEFDEFIITKDLYLSTAQELGLDSPAVTDSLDELERLLQHVVETKYLTSTARDYLMSFGERTSTKLFFEYLDKLGKETLQEWGLCDVTTSGRGGSDLTATTIARTLRSREIQVWKDVPHGVFTCDPKVSEKAMPIPYLTLNEAAELKHFDKQSIQLAMEAGISVVIKNLWIPQELATVITETRDMSKSKLTGIVLESNITILSIESTCGLEQSDFVAKASSIFHKFEYLGISLDRVATSAGNMLIALVPSKLLSQGLIELVLNNVDEELKTFASVCRLQNRSIISLIGNAEMSAWILEHALSAVRGIHVRIERSSQESSKVAKVFLVVLDNVAEQCVQVLHAAFFEFENGFVSEVEGAENGFMSEVEGAENGFVSEVEAEVEGAENGFVSEVEGAENGFVSEVEGAENGSVSEVEGAENGSVSEVERVENDFTVPVTSPAAASSGDKRKAEAPPSECQRKTATGHFNDSISNLWGQGSPDLDSTLPPEDGFLGGDFCDADFTSTFFGESSTFARMDFMLPPEDSFLGGDICGADHMSTFFGEPSRFARMESEVC